MDYIVVWHEALGRLGFAAGALAWIFFIIFAAYRMRGTRIKPFVRFLIFAGITAAYVGMVFLIVFCL